MTRLERLEKARGLLEKYRRHQPGPFKLPDSRTSCISGLGFQSSIWKNESLVVGRGQQLLLPPFMVPCVLDDLRTDLTIKYPMQVVPGEADLYCATVARSTGAAILSNDSDMTMYDLGPEGSLVLLDSLDLVSDSNFDLGHMHQSDTLKGLRLHPVNIARRLNVNQIAAKPSLLRYGFERFNDPSAPAGAIRSRCASSLSVEGGETFQHFRDLYQDSSEVPTAKAAAANKLVQLDPRLSELFCQYDCAEYVVSPPNCPHVYLPLMFEDPTRDSSWTYGRDIRILAYSLIQLAVENASNVQHLDSVIEFHRRGPRIVGMPFKLLSRANTKASMETVTEDLKQLVSGGDVLLKWRLFALKAINEEKVRKGKSAIPLTWATELPCRGYVDAELSWDDIHLYANMQAALYSLWLLKQACAVVSNSHKDEHTTMDDLGLALQTLGPLKRLMASRWEISPTTCEGSGVIVATALDSLGLQDNQIEQPGTASQVAPRSLGEATEPTAPKIRPGAKNKRRRTNQNIFEVLDSS